MFNNLEPITGGFGMRMLRKFGWKDGQCLGRSGEGVSQPVPVFVKVDRKGVFCLTLDKEGIFAGHVFF